MPKKLSTMIEEAQKHVIAEGLVLTGETHMEEEDKPASNTPHALSQKKGRVDLPQNPRPRRSAYDKYTPLTVPRREILNQIQNQNLLRRLPSINDPSGKRNRGKYCRYHRDHGHDTKECFELKEEIEGLIRRGQLRQFVSRPNK